MSIMTLWRNLKYLCRYEIELCHPQFMDTVTADEVSKIERAITRLNHQLNTHSHPATPATVENPDRASERLDIVMALQHKHTRLLGAIVTDLERLTNAKNNGTADKS